MKVTFRGIRIAILLAILAVVAANHWLGIWRTTDWDQPLWVTIYPVNGDGSAKSQKMIDQLEIRHFQPVADFVKREAQKYGVMLDQPLSLHLAPEVTNTPPPTPRYDEGAFAIAIWSLKMRWWARQNDSWEGPEPDIRLFVEYQSSGGSEGHSSFGLQKGRISVARLYPSRTSMSRNNVVIAHEILHTLGASDKYDLYTLTPHFPDGYADPQKKPLYPQAKAELMGGRIPKSAARMEMPDSLNACMIGMKTASEIGWID